MNEQHEHDDPWGDAMSTEFDRRVRDLHESPLSLDQVRGRAVRIRRRRRTAVAGAVLAAAAVVAPVAVLTVDRDDTADPVPRPGEFATDTTTPSAAPSRAVASYVEGSEFHRPDGSVSELPSSTYEGAVLLGDRVLAQRRDDQGDVAVDVVEDGAVVESLDAGTGLATSAAQDLAGLVTPTGEVRLFWAGGDRVLADGFAGYRIRGLVGGAACADAVDTGGDGDAATCRVALSDDGTSTQDPVVLDATGADAGAVPGALVVSDVGTDARTLVVESIADDGSCSALREGAREVFATCDYSLMQLSPSGDLVLAYPAYLDGFGPFTISVLDATTGEVVAEVVSDEQTALFTATWVDDDTIAFTALDFGAQQWTLSTLTAGEAEPTLVAGPAPGDDATPAFGLLGP